MNSQTHGCVYSLQGQYIKECYSAMDTQECGVRQYDIIRQDLKVETVECQVSKIE